MDMKKLPRSWNIRQKGKWIKDNFKEVDESVSKVGKAETARRLGIYVGSLYNLYTRRKKPSYGQKVSGRPKTELKPIAELSKSRRGKARKDSSRSPLRSVDTLLKASKGSTFSNSLVQSIISILEDYSRTKLELKSREEQADILLNRIKKLEIELLSYKSFSKQKSKESITRVLEGAKSALITYGD